MSGLGIKARFKDKARQFLQAHEDHLSLQRLRPGQALTPADLGELVAKAAADGLGLGIFIRSLVGMEREAVTHVFDEFLIGSTVKPDQIEFIEYVIAELTANGVMEPRRLYESPFVDLCPQGPEDLFAAVKVDRLFEILQDFRLRAAA